jgi:hypothetical protein
VHPVAGTPFLMKRVLVDCVSYDAIFRVSFLAKFNVPASYSTNPVNSKEVLNG